MLHNIRNHFFAGLITLFAMAAVVVLGTTATTNAQTERKDAHSPAAQQPYLEYRGVRVGMKAQEVRAKLGEPLQKADEMDFYAFSEKETAQIAYDVAHAVKAISVDYLGGVGAPDYKLVVGPDVELRPDGSIYKLIRYDNLGVWVYYNRTAGETPTITITIQKKLEGF